MTKKDLQIELASVKTDIQIVKWMNGLVLGGIVALVMKTFF